MSDGDWLKYAGPPGVSAGGGGIAKLQVLNTATRVYHAMEARLTFDPLQGLCGDILEPVWYGSPP